MNDEQLDTLARLQAFLDGTAAVDFAVAADERFGYRLARRTLAGGGHRDYSRVVIVGWRVLTALPEG